jgi:hypothetical protein
LSHFESANIHRMIEETRLAKLTPLNLFVRRPLVIQRWL